MTAKLSVQVAKAKGTKGVDEITAAWAWPMPAVQPAQLERYESGLRELLARHGLEGHGQVRNTLSQTSYLAFSSVALHEHPDQSISAASRKPTAHAHGVFAATD